MRSDRTSLSWRQLKLRINDKLVYIELWKKKLNTTTALLASVTMKAKVNDKKKGEIISEMNSYNGTDFLYGEDIPVYRESERYQRILAGAAVKRQAAEAVLKEISDHLKSSPARLRSPNSYVAPLSSYAAANDPIEPLDDETATLLRAIERHATYEDITYFRSLAEKGVPNSPNEQPSWVQGFISWYARI